VQEFNNQTAEAWHLSASAATTTTAAAAQDSSMDTEPVITRMTLCAMDRYLFVAKLCEIRREIDWLISSCI